MLWRIGHESMAQLKEIIRVCLEASFNRRLQFEWPGLNISPNPSCMISRPHVSGSWTVDSEGHQDSFPWPGLYPNILQIRAGPVTGVADVIFF